MRLDFGIAVGFDMNVDPWRPVLIYPMRAENKSQYLGLKKIKVNILD